MMGLVLLWVAVAVVSFEASLCVTMLGMPWRWFRLGWLRAHRLTRKEFEDVPLTKAEHVAYMRRLGRRSVLEDDK